MNIRLLCSVIYLMVSMGEAMAIEEPVYDVIEQSKNIEIRQYRPFIIAETIVEGNMDEASTAGFRRIAAYIFGDNQIKSVHGESTSEKIAMTAPVTVEPVKSEKIAMTAPVTVEPVSREGQPVAWRVFFVMPQAYTLTTLPKPRSELVSLREVPGKRQAVLTFSGFVSEHGMQKKVAELQQWLLQRNMQHVASAQLARYNPPWTLPFWRRNEVMIELPVPQ